MRSARPHEIINSAVDRIRAMEKAAHAAAMEEARGCFIDGYGYTFQARFERTTMRLHIEDYEELGIPVDHIDFYWETFVVVATGRDRESQVAA